MIILDPPALTHRFRLFTSKPEHQTFEAVLQLLNIDYECPDITTYSEWLVRTDTNGFNFLIYPGNYKMGVDVRGQADAAGAQGPHKTYQGAQGILELIFDLRTATD